MSNFHLEESSKEEESKKLKEYQKRLKDREVEDLKKILAHPEGRRFIWRLLSESGVFRTSFTGNSTTFFNEGKRDIGLLILSEVMKADMSKFTQMQNEFSNEQKKQKIELGDINGKRKPNN